MNEERKVEIKDYVVIAIILFYGALLISMKGGYMSARWFLIINTVVLLSIDYFFKPEPLYKATLAGTLVVLLYIFME